MGMQGPEAHSENPSAGYLCTRKKYNRFYEFLGKKIEPGTGGMVHPHTGTAPGNKATDQTRRTIRNIMYARPLPGSIRISRRVNKQRHCPAAGMKTIPITALLVRRSCRHCIPAAGGEAITFQDLRYARDDVHCRHLPQAGEAISHLEDHFAHARDDVHCRHYDPAAGGKNLTFGRPLRFLDDVHCRRYQAGEAISHLVMTTMINEISM